jgi:hypothetical protein
MILLVTSAAFAGGLGSKAAHAAVIRAKRMCSPGRQCSHSWKSCKAQDVPLVMQSGRKMVDSGSPISGQCEHIGNLEASSPAIGRLAPTVAS